jgi:hypothetical protein
LYQWSFINLQEVQDAPAELILVLRQIFADGFGLTTLWQEEDAQHALTRSTILGLLQNPTGQIGGYAFYTLPEAPLLGSHLLWEDAVCLRKSLQGQGYAGHKLFACIREYLNDRTVGWLGGRTQNPIVMRRYARFGETLPFNALYDEQPQVMNYLIEHIAEVQSAQQRMDKRTGICRQVYPEGRLGDYPTDVPGTEKYQDLLKSWGFSPERGDAVVVLTHLNEPL